MTIDQVCRYVLMSAYLYYHRDEQVLSDTDNDNMVQFLIKNWLIIPSRYLPLLDPTGIGSDSIAASTYACKWTRMVEGGAIAWLESKTGKKLKPLKEGNFEMNVTPKTSIENLF